MTLRRLNSFNVGFKKLSPEVQRRVKKQLSFLVQDIHHPSLNIKKMKDPRNILEGRITNSYRFTFQIRGDIFILRKVGAHDILKHP